MYMTKNIHKNVPNFLKHLFKLKVVAARRSRFKLPGPTKKVRGFATLCSIVFTSRGHGNKKVKRAGNLPTPHLEDMLAELENNTPR